MLKSVKLNWHRSVNFGDQLNPYIVKKAWNLNSYKVEENCSDNHLMMLGSILNEANSKTLVMGAGFVYPDREYKGNPKFISVRGKLTLGVLKNRGVDCSNIKIGDPAILIPKFYQPKIKDDKYRIGIIPHIIDFEFAESIFSAFTDCKIIDLRIKNRETEESEIERIIDDICSCETIVSSSLHGLIVAHAYGVPGTWCELSNNVIGEGFKFNDYLSSCEYLNPIEKIDFREKNKDLDIDLIEKIAKNSVVNLSSVSSSAFEALQNTWNIIKETGIVFTLNEQY
jgi:pyruvyltransferase